MKSRELFSLLKITIFLFIIVIIFFIMFVNFIKLMDFIVNIDTVLNNVSQEEEIPVLKNDFIDSTDNTGDYTNTGAHTAVELGYKDQLSSLNGSEWGDGTNILIVGSDKKNFQISKSRADVIILIRVIKSGKIMSVSIPRDSLIKITEGRYSGNMDKIGHSLYWGGMENLKKNVEDLVGSPISKVVIIDNFKSFEAFLSIIGGVSIDKILDGKTGIQWIRNRTFKFGDIERCKRQQLFLEKAVAKIWKITKNGNYFYVNFFYDALKKIVLTDMSKEEFLNIIYTLKMNNFDPEKDMYTGVLSGKFSRYDSLLLKIKNLTCWIPDTQYIEKLNFLLYSDSNVNSSLNNKNINFISFLKLDVNSFFNNKNIEIKK
jgi:anionic cell wall polymer biosynthesis LytR-Cps2A-Psr (LCP) family protein